MQYGKLQSLTGTGDERVKWCWIPHCSLWRLYRSQQETTRLNRLQHTMIVFVTQAAVEQ